MPWNNDLEYFRQRVIIERQRARSAPTVRIAAVHYELATLYEQVVQEAEAQAATAISAAAKRAI